MTQGTNRMKNKLFFLFLGYSCFSPAISSASYDLIFKARVGTCIGALRIYEDSSFLKPTEAAFGEGELLEIMSQTVQEYEDNAQNQKFRWYRVRAINGQMGWVFGDGLAVILPDYGVENRLKLFHKKKVRFRSGFEQTVMWVAAVEGREIAGQPKNFLLPPYREFYVVFTNERGKSVQINYAGASVMGKSELKMFHLEDINADGSDEIILQRSSLNGDGLENRTLEIHSFQGGSLTKIWEERLTLALPSGAPAPAFFKFIDIENQMIRVSYVDYSECEKNKKKDEICVFYLTTTYIWDDVSNQFKLLYKESKNTLYGVRKLDETIFLSQKQIFSLKKELETSRLEPFQVLRHYEPPTTALALKKSDAWLFVRSSEGVESWVSADEVHFLDVEHASVLEQYYEKKPFEANTEQNNPSNNFLRINGRSW